MVSHDRRAAIRRAAVTAAVAGMLAPVASEVRVTRPERPLTDRWREIPVASRHATRLGISFRPVQAETFELDPHLALQTLLAYPFEVIRLGAYWNRIETAPGAFDPAELDWQVAAAEEAGKQIIICVGPVKTFGYPEYFVPDHQLNQPLPEGALVEPRAHPSLLSAATAFVTDIVARYRDHQAVVAWQVEHEAVDPLGMEHSWRLSASFVGQEVEAARAADPTRPIIMNGFLPTSTPVRLSQWWRTRDQGDSLSVAQRLADVVGVDFYPRHALIPVGPWTTYLDGSTRPWQQRQWKQLSRWAAAAPSRQVIISEGQAEPWEAVTIPPDPYRRAMYSCLPEDVIGNYNQGLRLARQTSLGCAAYLFWGAEYWLLRHQHGDPRYLQAFERALQDSKPTAGPGSIFDKSS
ncbi:MAG TPA: beta-galactosidase [Acidimicrobiales bacterium]|nr:beta-galactosidase [Acidimicrobiales bacterium]